MDFDNKNDRREHAIKHMTQRVSSLENIDMGDKASAADRAMVRRKVEFLTQVCVNTKRNLDRSRGIVPKIKKEEPAPVARDPADMDMSFLA